MRTTVFNSKPILFSPPMVRAILEGRKTQTRRMLKPQPTKMGNTTDWAFPHRNGLSFTISNHPSGPSGYADEAPYRPGDVLWVRERCFDVRPYRTAPIFDGVEADFIYEADIHNALDGDHRFDNWSLKDQVRMRKAKVIGCHRFKPSIHMPRDACRLWLRVEAVRVERLQDITGDDAVAEGVRRTGPLFEVDSIQAADVVTAYALLWDSINGPGSWAANPWVWVYTFRRVEKPEGWLR